MSTPQAVNNSQYPLPQNGAKASKDDLLIGLDLDDVTRIAIKQGPGHPILEAYVYHQDMPRFIRRINTPKREHEFLSLCNRLCLMEWPSLVQNLDNFLIITYMGPKHEVLQNIKADRKAEISIIHDRILGHIPDDQTAKDIYCGTMAVLNNNDLTAFELESYLTELTNLAKEFGVEGL